jgi:hypothetical protein
MIWVFPTQKTVSVEHQHFPVHSSYITIPNGTILLLYIIYFYDYNSILSFPYLLILFSHFLLIYAGFYCIL